MKLSFHNHSCFSRDGFLKYVTPNRLIDRSFKKNIDVICVTDTNKEMFCDYLLENKERYLNKGKKLYDFDNIGVIAEKDNKKLLILRGYEHHKSQGHVLHVGTSKKNIKDLLYITESGLSIEDKLMITHEMYNHIKIPAHPCHPFAGGMGINGLLISKNYYEAIEGHNGQFICGQKKYNKLAQALSKKINKPWIACPDSHSLDQIDEGTFSCNKNNISYETGEKFIDSLKNTLKNRKYKNNCKYTNLRKLISWMLLPRIANPKNGYLAIKEVLTNIKEN